MNSTDVGTNEGKVPQGQLIPKKMIEHYSYALHEQIGKGFSSKVFLGKNEKTGEQVAVKVIDLKGITNDVERQLLNQEINALKIMNSPNILKMYDYYHTQNNTYIITEYCNQGDLESVLKRCSLIPEAEAAKILKHIMNGFKEQVRKGIIHRDIKPANIFLRNGIPKIADFGFSKMMNAPKEKVYYNVGTPLYMSPQTIMHNRYSEKSDMWSIGVLYYELLFGQVPWQAPSEKQLVDVMQRQAPYFNPRVAVSEESKDFLRRALAVEEETRLSVKDTEGHPLFMRRNTTLIQKPRALFSNTYNSSNHSTSVDKSPNLSMQQPKPVSPERRITAYARQSDNGQTNDPFRSRDLHPRPPIPANEHVSVGRPTPVWRPSTMDKLNDSNSKMDVESNSTQPQTEGHHRPNKSIQMGKTLIPGTAVTTPSSSINLQGKSPMKLLNNFDTRLKPTITHTPIKEHYSNPPPRTFDNTSNDIVQTQINIAKFLFRIVQIVDHFSFFQTPALKDRLSFLILKNIMLKSQKLKDMVDKGLNGLKLENYAAFLESGALNRLAPQINENHRKYADNFIRLWDQINANVQLKDELISDKKFDAIFDKSYLEYESFYLFLQHTLRQAIRELNHILRLWMENINEVEELSHEQQACLILLDYLVVYHVLCQITLETFDNQGELARSLHLENLANGRPGRLSKQTFTEVRHRIYSLKI